MEQRKIPQKSPKSPLKEVPEVQSVSLLASKLQNPASGGVACVSSQVIIDQV
ncbi:MAG TPA: hypothetical protein VGF75_06650 [Candidatus Saccharimonadales bacterium]